LNLLYNNDGTLDYDTMLEVETQHSPILEEEWDGMEDSIVSIETCSTILRTIHRKEDFVVLSLDKEEKKESESKPLELSKDEKEILDIEKAPVIYKPTTLDIERLEHPEVFEQEIIGKNLPKLSSRNQAQLLNVFSSYNRFGKMRTEVVGSTYTGNLATRRIVKHFGSLNDYDLSSVALLQSHIKGTEITRVSNDKIYSKGKTLLRRGFLSSLCNYWCYIMDIPYFRYDTKKNYLSGVKMWGITTNDGRNNLVADLKGNPLYFYDGNNAVDMVKDLLFIMRNKKLSRINDLVNSNKISNQLHEVIRTRFTTQKTPYADILQEFKSRLFNDFKSHDIGWSYSRLHPEYLLDAVLKPLTSGEFILDLLIPAIINTRKYPIKCLDTHLHPMSNQQHTINKDDYDSGNFLWERDDDTGNLSSHRPKDEKPLEDIVYCPNCQKEYKLLFYLCPNCKTKTKYISNSRIVKTW